MNVYVVFRNQETLLALFDNQEAAELYRNACRANNESKDIGYTVEECEVFSTATGLIPD